MAAMDKLLKALETLKIYISSSASEDSSNARSKEKIALGMLVTDIICSPDARATSDFQLIFAVAMETLLQMTDDPDSNIRMIADECLNRIIRGQIVVNVGKATAELHKEIKRNGAARSLRAALWRFAELAHLIKPAQGKAYVKNLVPCLKLIAARKEESVLETLANAVPKIMKALGCFMSDNEAKDLLQEFMYNLKSDNAVVRRTAATSIVGISVNCPNSQVFMIHTLTTLLDSVIPVKDDQSIHTVLGVLNCIRGLIPHLEKTNGKESYLRGSFGVKRNTKPTVLPVDTILQVYELCLHWTYHDDHNVITAALETLHELLSSPPDQLVTVLIDPQGLSRSRIHAGISKKLTTRTLSQLSVGTSSCVVGDESHLVEDDLISNDKVTEWLSAANGGGVPASLSPSRRSTGGGAVSPNPPALSSVSDCLDSESLASEELGLILKQEPPGSPEPDVFSGHVSPSPPLSTKSGHHVMDWEIGTVTTTGSPLLFYCARRLVSGFLVAECTKARVSVRCLALNTLCQVVRLCPEVFTLSIDKHGMATPQGTSHIFDVLKYSIHSDPQLRGLVTLLLSQYIHAKYSRSPTNSVQWLTKTSGKELNLKILLDILLQTLKDESSVCIRHALSASGLCIPSILESNEHGHCTPILNEILNLVHNAYWLVKVKVIEFFGVLPYVNIHYVTGGDDYQKKVIESLVVLLGDEDSRVRKATADVISKLINKLFYPDTLGVNSAVEAKGVELNTTLFNSLQRQRNKAIDRQIVEGTLSRLIHLLVQTLMMSSEKYAAYGCIEALYRLSEDFLPGDYPLGWQCLEGSPPTDKTLSENCLLSLVVALLTKSALSLDLECHRWLLILAGNIFFGKLSHLSKRSTEDTCPALYEDLLVHAMRILRIFTNVMEEKSSVKSSGPSPLRKKVNRSSSPPLKVTTSSEKDVKDDNKRIFGASSDNPHCLKLNDVIKAGFSNYRLTLDRASSEKFTNLISSALKCTEQLLTHCNVVVNSSLIAEELLQYSSVTFLIDPTATVRVANQLLKTMMEINKKRIATHLVESETAESSTGFYVKVFQKPHEDMTCYIAPTVDASQSPKHETFKATLTVDINTLALRIKLFEGIVIQSLKVYTITSNVQLQVEVLALLTQLVQLKVNYYLLDAGQIFVRFVKEQFEYLEKGQIRDPELLIPQIFKFLVHLSNDKNHSKPVISVPEIIQLCDGLLASGRNPVTHCIPALMPVVEHVFLFNASNVDVKELEAEREVIFNMLIRLAEFPQVLDILLYLMKEGWRWEEHWKRWYRKTVDTVLPLLAEGKLLVNDISSLLSLLYLNENFCAPLNNVLVLLFSHQQESQTISQWMGMLAAMLISVSLYKEKRVLLQLEEMNLYVREEGDDPLKVNAVSKTLPSSVLLSKLVLRVVATSVDKLNESIKSGRHSDSTAAELERNLATFLLCWVSVFRLGKYQEVSKSLQKLLRSESEFKSVNDKLASVGFIFPRLTLVWIELIMLLDIGDDSIWKLYLADQPSKSLNLKLIQRGSVLFFCEYLANHHNDIDPLKWFLKERARDVIWNCHEPPVEKLLSSIFNLEANSKILLDSVSQFINVAEPIFVHRMLHTLENIHSTYTGCVLHLVVTSLIRHRNIGITRLAAAFCCRTVEYLLLLEKTSVHGILKHEELLDIYESLKNGRKNYRKHNALLSLLKKLSEDVYGIKIEETGSDLKDDIKSIVNIKLDKNWYLEQIKQKCSYLAEPNGMQCARLLSQVDSEDELIEIMTCDSFDMNILQHCFSLGTLLTLQVKIQNGGTDLDHLVPLYTSARRCLLKAVHEVCDSLTADDAYERSIDRVLARLSVTETLYPLVLAVIHFFESLHDLALHGNLSLVVPKEFHQDICLFALFCSEVIVWILERKSEWEGWPSLIHNLLACCAIVFSYDVLGSHLRLCDVQIVRKAVLEVHNVTTGEDMSLKEFDFGPEKQYLINQSESLKNGVEIGKLLNWIDDPAEKKEIPGHVLRSLKSVIISLGRIHNINWLWSVPPDLWQIDTVESNSPLPVPFHFLQDSEILQQIVNRIRLLGWTGRQQFEEAWVCLLGTLSPGGELDDPDPEEVAAVAQAKSLAIEGITWLVISTLTLDVGRSFSTRLLHIPRLDSTKLRSLRYWKRLEEINEVIKWKTKMAHRSKAMNAIQVSDRPNLDRLESCSSYGFGQLSVEHLRKRITERESISDDLNNQHAGNVDVRSCIQFVLDLYQQWTQPNSGIPLNLQFSMVKSIVCLSDLFTEESHFQWMLDTFATMIKSHSPQDENIHQYLILGTAKASAVLESFDGEIGEKVLKIVEFGLKSNLNLLRTASVHGILYLLQSVEKIEKPDVTAEVPKQSVQEFRQKLISMTLEYILGSFNVHDQFYSSELVLTMDLACYFAELYHDELTPSSRQYIINALAQVASKPCNNIVYQCAIHGWERLVLVGSDEFKESATRLALDRLAQSDPLTSLPALKLLVACIYADENKVDSSEDEPVWTMEIMEKTSALFDKIKKGYPIEVEIICHILPRILSDFFPVSDVSTKVIGEFLSPNQPHKRNMADTVFQVFSQAIKEGQLPLLQDWIVHSLNNFTHNLPVVTSCWSLCCFFICASDNPWLRALFPHVQSRIRQCDYEDRTLLCIAALQFYNKLNNEQKATFLKSFKETAASQKSAFSDIISCIE